LVVRSLNICVSGFALALALLATPALADVAPIDACMAADVGNACDSAGPNGNQAGICKQDMCTRTTPDGQMTYECYVCKATGNEDPGESDEDDGNCNAAAVPVGGLAGLAVPLLALGLAAARRRRTRR
jgi:MYXO-CTERM domain-containing protein